MKISLSGRIAEAEHIKDQSAVSFTELAQLAGAIGYQALCIRPAQLPAQATADDLHVTRQILDRHGLQASDVSLHTGITANTVDTAPFQQAFGRDLDRAQILGAGMMRISIKTEADVVWAQRAADQARERGIRLVQQTHTYSFKSLRGKRWPANELSTAAHSGRALN